LTLRLYIYMYSHFASLPSHQFSLISRSKWYAKLYHPLRWGKIIKRCGVIIS
jgi:hypothetical protein